MIHVTDSADARELREAEAEQAEAEEQLRRTHAEHCHEGWLGLDAQERPRPCPRCRPHLAYVACRTCSIPHSSCDLLRSVRRGQCCAHCDHAAAPVKF
jgi:hypothetical protein